MHKSTRPTTARPPQEVSDEIKKLYLADNRPWVVGYSGGKDSTTVLSLVLAAVQALPPESRKKDIYVVSSDTLVETPVVVDHFRSVIDAVNDLANRESLPVSAHQVYPNENATFWVNLLGKGYPAPTKSFRWCTERMKIDPVTEFILDKVTRFGEVLVVLGTRSQESATRAQAISKHKLQGTPLGRHSSLPSAYTYMPIVDWTHDDVWSYLLNTSTPWGGTNDYLFQIYKDSNAGECPLVIDTSTPSCGNSRFGCWTCTVVTKDKALEGMVETGAEWMRPLLRFRNMLWHTSLPENKAKYRNFKRRTGKVTYVRGSKLNDDGARTVNHIPGPYLMRFRKRFLRLLLKTEKRIREQGHDIQLIRPDELHRIRQEWMYDPIEPDLSDELPKIYRDVYGSDLDWNQDDARVFSKPDAL